MRDAVQILERGGDIYNKEGEGEAVLLFRNGRGVVQLFRKAY